MAIPDFQSIMLPLLKLCGDGITRKRAELTERLALSFALTEEEVSIKTQVGVRQFDNRVQWAVTYLKKSGLLQYPNRGFVEITPRGLDVLATSPAKINTRYLRNLGTNEEFFNSKSISEIKESNGSDEPSSATPEEIIDAAFNDIQERLADEILDSIKRCSPAFMEQLIVDLVLAMGYGGSKSEAGMAIGRSGDEGIDGIINEDKLGLDVIYLQAKRWEGSVGRPEIQKFVGALSGKRSRKGIFITTGYFTKEAEEYVKNIEFKIILIDGKRLSNLMIEHNVGVSTASTYLVKKIDSDFFQE